MNENAKTVDTVREIHFINRKCGFVQQLDTHTISLEKINILIKVARLNL